MENAQELLNQAVACKRRKDWVNAAAAFERVLQIDPDHAPAYFELADLSQTLGRTDTAIAFYMRSINLEPGNTVAFLRLGELLYAGGNWVGAENCFARVVDTGFLSGDPANLAFVMSKLGIALIRQEKLEQAVDVFKRILEIDPTMGEMYSNLAYVYERMGRLDEALAAGQRSVELAPAYAEGHNNLGVAYRALHLLDEARQCFARAAAMKPEFSLAEFNLGTVHLMQGDYGPGWRGYEWRNRTLPKPPRQFTVPRWDGRPMPGLTLFVHTEQGYGDTIQFARFLHAARERSQAKIVLEGPAALLPLLRTVAGVDEVICAGAMPPPIAAEIPLPSLPGVLQIELGDLPLDVPYLTIPESFHSTWHERMARFAARSGAHQSNALKVGFVWAGNPAQEQNVVRSCRLSHFARLASTPGIAWYSLQKDADDRVIASEWPASGGIVALGPLLGEFADTAAAIGELDLVISVDTSVAHLAGALGRPVWTLLSHTPDWRWQLDRTDSAWYPTMRLFRQPRWGDWEAVFASVAEALSSFPVSRGGFRS